MKVAYLRMKIVHSNIQIECDLKYRKYINTMIRIRRRRANEAPSATPTAIPTTSAVSIMVIIFFKIMIVITFG
jgi:hypothetical protein